MRIGSMKVGSVVAVALGAGALSLPLALAGLTEPKATDAPGLQPAAIGRDWVRWDNANCKLVVIPRAQRPKKYVALLRRPRRPAVIGFAEQTESSAFPVAINTSVKKAAQTAKVQLVVVNYQHPDTSKFVPAAEALVQQKAKVVISYMGLASAIPAVNKIYAEACIPVIQITLRAPGAALFGASNDLAGTIAGKFLANYVKGQKWDPAKVTLVGPLVPTVGVSVNRRITSCAKIFRQELPKASYSEMVAGPDAVTSLAAMRDWLTAHPASGPSTYIVSCTLADLFSNSLGNALKAAGRDSNAAIIGQGASRDGLEAILAGGPVVASVVYRPDLYGNFTIAMALDLLEGKPIPITVHQKLSVATKNNARDYLLP